MLNFISKSFSYVLVVSEILGKATDPVIATAWQGQTSHDGSFAICTRRDIHQPYKWPVLRSRFHNGVVQ